MAQLPLQRVRGLPSPEVRISYATPTVLASPVTAPIFVKTPDTVSGRSTPMAMAFQPTQALAPAVQKVSTPRCAEAPKVKAPEVEVPQPDLPGPPAEVSPRERSKTPKTPRTPRSLQNSLSQPAVGGHLPGRIQGISCCALCHSLLQIFAGKVRIQTFANSSELPAPPARLVDRALAYELSEADDVAASDTFCRLHHLHKNRYELWLKGQDAIRRCTARGDAQATRVIRSCAEEMGKLDNICGKVEQEYLEAFASFFKQLQQDVRENLFKTLMGKADELVNAWQHEIEEVNQQIDKKVQQKRHNLQTAVHRRHEAAKEDFWRQHEKQCAQQFVSCLVDNCRNMHIGRAMDASTAFKELELSQQARRPATEKSVEGKAQSRADQERAKREREMKIWLSKMDQLQTLQHLQACKDRELVYLRVAMTIRRLEEDQGVEHRLVVSRVSQHLQQMRMFLEKTLRASGVSSCVDLMGVTPGSIVLERESFIHMVLRNERILGDVSACGGGGASPRSARSAQSACQGISASFASGSRGGKGADQLGASLELRAFGEFLGARFPSLRAAMSAMDLTGTGRVACFELESWLRQHMYPGNARMLLKDLGRKGSLGMPQLRFLAPSFVRAGQCGRPSGATAASLLRRLWGQSDLRARRYQPLEAQQAAIRCCRCICSFLNAAISVSLVDEPQDLHETASVAGTGRLGDQGLGTFQSVLSSRSRGEREPSLAEIGGRSKLEAVKGDVDKRRSMMHYRPSSARVPSEKLTPRNLRGKSHQQRRDAELKRLSPMSLPKCIQTIRGRSLKQRLQSPPRSRSNSPTRSRTGSPVRRLLEIGEPVEDRLAPPPYVPPTASPSTTVAEAKEVEEQDSEAIGPVVRRRSQHLSHTVSAGSLQPSGSAQQLLLSRPCASRPLIRSPSAPPVVYTTLRSVAGAPSTPLTLAAPPVTVAAPIVRQVSLGRKELSPRVRWESDGPTPKAPVPSTGSLRRSTTLQMPATVRVSSTPCLTKAQSLPTTPLLPVTLNSISPSGSASNSPRFFVSGSTPMNYRPPVTTVGPVMPLSGVTGTPVASVAATWAVFGEKTRGASAGPGRVRNGSPEVFGI